jgi:hypothetical protein
MPLAARTNPVSTARSLLAALAVTAVGLAAALASASPNAPADPPSESDRATVEVWRLETQHGQRMELLELPVLDPAVFTGISPYSAAQDAVRLPEDQRLE